METLKVLGQIIPSAGSLTSTYYFYTVPADASAVVSSLVISNVSSAAALCRVYVVQSGFGPGLSNALVYDAYVNPSDVLPLTLGITLGQGDSLVVASSVANSLTFHAFGSEISA
jgi:hypothetical protein